MAYQGVVLVSGKQVVLRPVEKDDLPFYYRYINDPQTRQFLQPAWPLSMAAEEEWYNRQLNNKENMVLAIVTADNGELIGSVGLHQISWVDQVATAGIFIGPTAARGRGYGRDATMAALNYAFNYLNLRKICAQIYDFNAASLACARACGFQVEGQLKAQVFRNGAYHDSMALAVFKADWLPLWQQYC